MNTQNAAAANIIQNPTTFMSGSPKLQASAQEKHPASYYDKSSSHYMGGAHNVLLNFKLSAPAASEERHSATFRDESGAHNTLIQIGKDLMSGKQSTVRSSEDMGGNHNVAMAMLAEQSNKFKKARYEEKKNQSLFSMLTSKTVSATQFQRNLKETGAFVAFISTLAVCIWFYVTLKTYHAQLEKQDQLTAILKNPNARVAAGKKGKEIVKKLQDKNTELKAESVPKEAGNENSIETLIAAAKAKKKANETRAAAEALLSSYQAPQITVEKPLLQAAQPQFTY